MVAEQAVNQRQYQTAVDLAQQAVDLDPSSWWSYGVLGMNQLRTGAVEEGRANLEKAFAGDPYNPWYKNTLDLLDTFVHFERSPPIISRSSFTSGKRSSWGPTRP